MKIFFDWENFYNISMLVLTILAWAITPYFYAIMLLDIVKRSRDLQNVV